MEVATRLFTENGLFEIQMKDIAIKAEVSRNTLYRYFQDKSDLALEILTQMLNSLIEQNVKAVNKDSQMSNLCGWERLKLIFHKIWIEPGFANELKFMAEFDAFYSGSRLSSAFLEKMHKHISTELDDYLLEIVKSGIADKSIRADRDPHLMVITMINAIRGLKQRLILRANSLVEVGDFEREHMLSEFLDIIFDGIKGDK